MYCPECGKVIKRQAVICPYCGVQVKKLVKKTDIPAIRVEPETTLIGLGIFVVVLTLINTSAIIYMHYIENSSNIFRRLR